MQSDFLSINWLNIKSAITSALIMGFLAICGYILGVGSIWDIDFHNLANAGVLAVLTAIVSILKSYFTTPTGTFAGIVQIK